MHVGFLLLCAGSKMNLYNLVRAGGRLILVYLLDAVEIRISLLLYSSGPVTTKMAIFKRKSGKDKEPEVDGPTQKEKVKWSKRPASECPAW
jgi:hypothetical protein